MWQNNRDFVFFITPLLVLKVEAINIENEETDKAIQKGKLIFNAVLVGTLND